MWSPAFGLELSDVGGQTEFLLVDDFKLRLEDHDLFLEAHENVCLLVHFNINLIKFNLQSQLKECWFLRPLIIIIYTMESRSYMFSTAKKRSTLLESKGIE